MANTVSVLSYANTFGDWVVTTNALAKENNDIAANNYIKPTGTLFLNDSTLGLQIATNAIVGGQLQVQGLGSSAYVQNNMNVGSQVYFTNTTLGLVNAGQAIIQGLLSANGSGIGIIVANNAQVNGNTSINGTLYVNNSSTLNNATTLNSTLNVVNNTALGNNLLVANNTTSNNITSNNNTTTVALYVSTLLQANGAYGYIKEFYIDDQLTVNGNFVLTGTAIYDTNRFVINAGSNIGLNSYYSVNRGISGANASIRWNESSLYWDILDVTGGTYSKILTSNNLPVIDNLLSTSITSVASANTVNALNILVNSGANSLQSQLTSNVIYLQSQISSNVSYIAGIDSTQNTNITAVNNFAGGAYTQANAATNSSTFAYARANAGFIQANAAFTQANAGTNSAQSAYTQANAAFTQANAAFTQANAGNSLAISGYYNANQAFIQANSAFTQANAATNSAQAAYTKANTAIGIVNDTSTNDTRYINFTSATSGSVSGLNTASSILTFNPSTGIVSATQFSASSDEILKEEIETIKNALATVIALRGVFFKWKKSGEYSFGVIAQELEKILPQLVRTSDSGIKSVLYDGIIGILIEAVKELSDQVEELKTK